MSEDKDQSEEAIDEFLDKEGIPSIEQDIQINQDTVEEVIEDKKNDPFETTTIKLEVTNVPNFLEYGNQYVVEVSPPDVEAEVKTYFVDKNENTIEKSVGTSIGIPAFNTRLSKNWPEGRYEIVVSVAGIEGYRKRIMLYSPSNDKYRKVKASM